jgi:hypothetical protein
MRAHINTLLSHVDLEEVGVLPTSIFSMVDEWLRHNYPPVGEEQLNIVCECVQTLRRIVSTLPVPLVIPFLVSLSGGLCLWIRDELETLTESEYNDVVQFIYSET